MTENIWGMNVELAVCVILFAIFVFAVVLSITAFVIGCKIEDHIKRKRKKRDTPVGYY